MQTTESFPEYTSNTHVLDASANSAVSWAAVIAGAVIGAALTATLVIGGTGLGFLTISPWSNEGASTTTIGISTVVWLFVTQIIAYGIAGYVTGRLRTKWLDPRKDEIHFRDTAHGFLVWALSFVVGLVLLGSTAVSLIAGMTQASSVVASSVASQVVDRSDTQFSMDYFVDALLRSKNPDVSNRQADIHREVALIVSQSVARGKISEQDQTYLVQIIARRAGISEPEAQERLEHMIEQTKQTAETVELKARETADVARKAAATLSLWIFASLLFGAFVSSFAATIGGRARDID